MSRANESSPPWFPTYPANSLIWVKLTDRSEVQHPVGSFELPRGRTAIHPVTFASPMSGPPRSVSSMLDRWFVTDLPTGQPLPLLGKTLHAARALAEAWQHAVGKGQLDPSDQSAVIDWAMRFAARSPDEVRPIREMQWPPGLPPSPYHSN